MLIISAIPSTWPQGYDFIFYLQFWLKEWPVEKVSTWSSPSQVEKIEEDHYEYLPAT